MVSQNLVAKYRKEILNNDNAIRDILIGMNKDTTLNDSVSRIIIKVFPNIVDIKPNLVIKMIIGLALELMSWEKAVREEENAKKAISDITNDFIDKAMKLTEEEKRKMNTENFKQSIMLISEMYIKSKDEKELLIKILARVV